MRALSINALAELTGIMPGTLRAWEARYRTLKPKRDRSNNRRFYSYDDVEKIRAIKQLLDQGLNIGRIARLEKSELLGLLQDLKPAEPPPVLAADNTESLEAIGECIQLLEGYKLKELHHRITRLRLNLSLEQFVNEFVVPFFYRIGLLYEVNKISVAQEHAF
jgi:DNA-binding transcriptional MerR regulator